VAFIRYWSAHRLADRVRPPVNVIVSNVPGPREPLSVGNLQLEAFYSVGPILEGIGLNLTGWSYGDRINVVALACPDQIEDVQALADRLPDALDELVAACHALESRERGASEVRGE
jgi:diacylglycerol O-acyltransferase